ncbi:hypothetical protein PVAG01_06494 [Phlyctema vagabunda]|uniref:C2H2-type domain-containing protein n=1 Tax=Phlyctema vagabunda TaxID=108571 RepID=A0ABR4PG76_9HELO
METAQSFTARRSAASNLPTFQLPPPDHLSGMHKYPAYAPSQNTQPAPVSNVLTPPAALPSDGLSPMASSVNSGSSGSSAGGVPPYQPMGYWPTPQNQSYTYTSAPPIPTTYAQIPNYSMGRPLYSPSMNFHNRGNNSPNGADGLPAPPYDMTTLPPFPTMSSGGGGGGGQQNLPALAPQQHQQQMNNTIMNSQQPASQAPQQGPLHAPDNYGGRPPPTPTYYTPSSTPQQPSFPAYTQQTPPQHSPNHSSGPSHRPSSAQSHHQMAAPQGYHPRPYTGYNLPAMSGPIMSNVHSPGNQMSLVGGMSMQYPSHQMNGQVYGHPGQQQPQNDRPFKCDQCAQSFNRNHDLKRHKRIHLAVKPFPCGHCEKSFSRKDALKRHILVKGCGKPQDGTTNAHADVDKSEIMSDSASDSSPTVPKRERD